jgi:hypothetical protein
MPFASAKATSAMQPQVNIMVLYAPMDLQVQFLVDGQWTPGRKSVVAWETTFVYYDWQLSEHPVTAIKVEYGAQSYELQVSSSGESVSKYMLNLGDRSLHVGHYAMRTFILAALRVLLTLFVEGLLFFKFGFRAKHSWIIFFAVNLALQVVLNWRFGTGGALSAMFILFMLPEKCIIAGIETLVIGIAVREHTLIRRLLFPVVANIASFIVSMVVFIIVPL